MARIVGSNGGRLVNGGGGSSSSSSSSFSCSRTRRPLLLLQLFSWTTTSACILLLIIASTSSTMMVSAEIQDFAITLQATDRFIHYADGFLRGPDASIDLRDLSFEATSEAGTGTYDAGDDLMMDNYNDDGTAGAGTAPTTGGGGGRKKNRRRQRQKKQRQLAQQQQQHRQQHLPHHQDRLHGRHRHLEGGMDVSGVTHVDIVSFLLPANCANSKAGCDWTTLGVGAKLDDGTLRWCCTDEAVTLGLCSGDSNLGRLIVSSDFPGEQRSIDVPHTGVMKKKLKNDYFEFEESGRYVVVFANCDVMGREITVTGQAVWKSEHGYLPGELYEFYYFYIALFGVYVLLLLWYGCLMRCNVESRIPIEKWIFITIIMGLSEMLLRVVDYSQWNSSGNRMDGLTYTGILLGVFKDGFSRCLIVMVSLGWGVIRDTLGAAMPKVVVLGIVYIALATCLEFTIEFAVKDMQTLSYDNEIELYDLATIFNFVVAAIDVIFIMWILDALNGTMTYLENMNQTRKLSRYLRLRTMLLFAILFATVWAVFSLVDMYDEDGIVREEHEWVVDAATEVNYLAVLFGVAILWRPNPNAKEYAYVMELPAMGGDGETELELTDVVPSALDDDDNDELYSNGGGSPGSAHDGRFKIDEGELS